MQPKEVQQLLNEKPHAQIYYKNTPVLIKSFDKDTNKAVIENLQTKNDAVVHVKTLNEKWGHRH